MISWTTLLYMFVAQPVTSNLINKNPGKRGIIYAILALCLMASFTTYTGYLSEKDESLYSLLEIPVTTPQTQIKRAYRKVSLKYHPDKQVDLDDTAKEKATERFAKIQEASEVLQDSRAREIYDKFGPRAVRNYQKNISDDPSMSALISLGINFAIWGLLTFMLTLSDSGSQSRTYSFSGLVAITLVAWQLQLDDFDFLVDYLWFWTKYDKAQILIQLYPPFMRGASIIANAQFVDKEKIRNEQIQWIMNALQVLHEKVEKLDGRKLPNKNKSQVEDETLSTTIASSGGTVDLLKRSQLKKMAAKKKGGVSGASKKLKDPAKTTSSEFGIPSWAWGIGVYFFINWVLS